MPTPTSSLAPYCRACTKGWSISSQGLSVRAGLADWWTTPEDTVWRLHVREGVRFHDGSVLTPSDVIRSIERARSSGVAGHQLANIIGVRELDERVVEITTDVPTPLLLTRLETWRSFPRNSTRRSPWAPAPLSGGSVRSRARLCCIVGLTTGERNPTLKR